MFPKEGANGSADLGCALHSQSSAQQIPMGILADTALLVVDAAHCEGFIGEQIPQDTLPDRVKVFEERCH